MKISFTNGYLKCLVPVLIMLCCREAYCQNIGINTTQPKARLEVAGSLLVSSPFRTAVGSAILTNMVHNEIKPLVNDSIVRFYDPGGFNGPYSPNMFSQVVCSGPGSGASQLEITIETLQLGTGDSLIISEYGAPIYAVGNTSFSGPATISSSSGHKRTTG